MRSASHVKQKSLGNAQSCTNARVYLYHSMTTLVVTAKVRISRRPSIHRNLDVEAYVAESTKQAQHRPGDVTIVNVGGVMFELPYEHV